MATDGTTADKGGDRGKVTAFVGRDDLYRFRAHLNDLSAGGRRVSGQLAIETMVRHFNALDDKGRRKLLGLGPAPKAPKPGKAAKAAKAGAAAD